MSKVNTIKFSFRNEDPNNDHSYLSCSIDNISDELYDIVKDVYFKLGDNTNTRKRVSKEGIVCGVLYGLTKHFGLNKYVSINYLPRDEDQEYINPIIKTEYVSSFKGSSLWEDDKESKYLKIDQEQVSKINDLEKEISILKETNKDLNTIIDDYEGRSK